MPTFSTLMIVCVVSFPFLVTAFALGKRTGISQVTDLKPFLLPFPLECVRELNEEQLGLVLKASAVAHRWMAEELQEIEQANPRGGVSFRWYLAADRALHRYERAQDGTPYRTAS